MVKRIGIFVLIIFVLVFSFLFIGWRPPLKEITWGVNFSQKHARDLGLDWAETYSALIDELGVRNIKLAVHWDLIEKDKGEYSFKDLDWQVNKAEEEGVELILVIGMKTPRWPECHLPFWVEDLEKDEQQERVLALIREIVLRYRGSSAIVFWQVENEPFFSFGQCPWRDDKFLKEEIALVRSLDNRPVIISDSGEYSFWFKAAHFGDAVGITMYRKVWFHQLKTHFTYPLPALFYARKGALVKLVFNKEVINGELQAEPWGASLLYDSPLEEQERSMNMKQFKKNIEFAQRAGFQRTYFWGAEWWYWLKEKGQPQYWQEAEKMFKI